MYAAEQNTPHGDLEKPRAERESDIHNTYDEMVLAGWREVTVMIVPFNESSTSKEVALDGI